MEKKAKALFVLTLFTLVVSAFFAGYVRREEGWFARREGGAPEARHLFRETARLVVQPTGRTTDAVALPPPGPDQRTLDQLAFWTGIARIAVGLIALISSFVILFRSTDEATR